MSIWHSTPLKFTSVIVAFFAHGLAWGAPARAAEVAPGRLLSIKPADHRLLPDAAENLVISYSSTSLGRPAVIVGLMAIPKTPAPKGGYPVLSYAPGTTGAAPQCAPSIVQSYPEPYLNEWVKRGYVVLRTDFAGWGADWPRPDVNPRNDAAAIADIVAAAHETGRPLGDDWIAIGHSLGGGGVLWAAAKESNVSGPYRLKGAIGLAPVGPGILKFMRDVAGGAAIPQFVQQFVSLTVIGAKLQDPSIDLGALVAPEMAAQVDMMRDAVCLGDPRFMTMAKMQPGHIINPGLDFDKLVRVLETQDDPSALTMRVPVFIAQGTDDETTVTPATSRPMAESLCAHGGKVAYTLYEHQTHRGVIVAAQDDTFAFAADVLAGRTPKGVCNMK